MTLEPFDSTQIVAFWRAAGPESWFAADPAFDAAIRDRFADAHLAASRGIDPHWGESTEAALAFLLLTDQFPRNLYRGSAHAYATDGLARTMAEHALGRRFDLETEPALRMFFYLPLQHHEDADSQARSVAFFTCHQTLTGDREGLRYARHHADIIARFGRFPHRNIVLGRASTAEELEFLAGGET